MEWSLTLRVLTPSFNDVELVMGRLLVELVSLVRWESVLTHGGAMEWCRVSALPSSRSGRGGVLRFVGSDRELSGDIEVVGHLSYP